MQPPTVEEEFQANVLGWCIEWVRSRQQLVTSMIG